MNNGEWWLVGPVLGVMAAGGLWMVVWVTRIPGAPGWGEKLEDRCGMYGGGCWLPELTRDIWNSGEYRCIDCGQRWRVGVDMRADRENWRYWQMKGHRRVPIGVPVPAGKVLVHNWNGSYRVPAFLSDDKPL